jgi:hypothetical protein
MTRRRITKAEWTAAGGLRNPHLYRRQTPAGRWLYFRTS